MDSLLVVLLLLSIIGLAIGLIHPKLFSKVFRKRTNRKTISLVFGLAILAFFILIAVTNRTPVFAKVKSPTNQSSAVLSANNAFSNAKVELYQNGNKIQDLKTDAAGKFSANVELKEGDNKFKTIVTSEKGKVKTSAEINIVYDKTPPTIVYSS